MQKKLWIIFLHFECTIIILANNYLEIIIRNNLGSIKLLIFDSNVICSQLLPRKLSLLIFYNHFFSLFLSIFLSFNGKQAEVQPAETHPMYLCQFVFNGCVFVNIFILTDKNTSTFSYVLIKVQPHSDICTPTYLYALTIVTPQFYVHLECTIIIFANNFL